MAKARSRAAARKVKDRWKAKSWYNILAPAAFENATIAQTLTNNADLLIDRVTEVSMQDLTNDFRKSHIVLYFKIHNVEDGAAHTHFVGHTLTSDYLRRMVRRRRSKIEGVYDVTTRDGAKLRVKPFATTDKRIQNSQKRVIRESMKKTIETKAKSNTLFEFIKDIIDGNTGRDIYKNCKELYPVKRVEIYKTEVVSQPTIEIKDKPKKKEEKKEEKPKKEEVKETKEEKTEKKTEESKDKEKTKETKKSKKEEKEKPEKKETKKETKKKTKSKTKKETKEKKEKPKKTTKKKTTAKKKATSKKKEKK